MNIFFDLDGTLIDIAHRHHATYASIVTDMGGVPLPLDTYWNLKRENTPITEILEQSGMSPDQKDAFLTRFINTIERPNNLALVTTFPGVREMLETLKQHHTLFLVSLRRDAENLRNELNELSLDTYFTEIGSGHKEEQVAGTTRSAIIDELNRKYPSPIALIVGDTESDIIAAKQIGLPSVAVLSGIRSRRLLEEQAPDYVINDVRELPALVKTLDR